MKWFKFSSCRIFRVTLNAEGSSKNILGTMPSVEQENESSVKRGAPWRGKERPFEKRRMLL